SPGRPAVSASEVVPVEELADCAAYQRRCRDRQQAIGHGVGGLRARLRHALAAASPPMARLAALDAVMERVLAGHEHGLLAVVPGSMRKHFEALRDGDASAQTEPSAPAPMDGPGVVSRWRVAFCRDLQGVMLAELALRLQPVDGLLAALEAARTALPASREPAHRPWTRPTNPLS
ncbi:MAG: hypothetical protein JWQ11_1518, partial [Rhizobacter sp.]|nr:hypothetical protein [Rhizobacter sp.]